ncbi:hypothetical protein CNMCM5793_003901 [Aspergillus hiratsukae]|uniref:Uncharacterized protein n=1 Tax=Aspergillus hiratsukae TaxID=1194566 RepID=A0A8H6UYT0_9EURO|nr:hypothetical protein CNMCM5793_003901 [Aspergillus hiratsukae]KAF7171762.1 hypothetical protein CNMCM6106_006144 [Aspergillus hiratsukae]
MATLTTPAIIVIVIVVCLAAVSLGAALTRQLSPAESTERFQPSYDQEMYMRSVRRKNLGLFHRESTSEWPVGRDLESRYTFEETSSRG